MKSRFIGLAAAVAVAAAFGVVDGKDAAAKTLVYCSEGSPEGFNPSLFTSGTTFDASSRNIFNRLVEFERGSTTIVPALAESWSTTADGLSYTFKLRPGVKFHTTKNFTPGRSLKVKEGCGGAWRRGIYCTQGAA